MEADLRWICPTRTLCGRSPVEWILANGKYPPRTSEPLSDARTMYGKRRISVRRGWAGEKGGFFSILIIEEPVRVRARFRVVQLGELARPQS